MTSTTTTQLPRALYEYSNICLLSDFFSDGVFDLEPGVDFNEVVLAMFVHQEFDGASVLVAHLQEDDTAGKQLYYCEPRLL